MFYLSISEPHHIMLECWTLLSIVWSDDVFSCAAYVTRRGEEPMGAALVMYCGGLLGV